MKALILTASMLSIAIVELIKLVVEQYIARRNTQRLLITWTVIAAACAYHLHTLDPAYFDK